ncbi:MAG: DPP IV N-terminal domain-containing protein [Planctomycetes bacterium]|nr:DPP IV N-terminal domain-containing protein [Planctomycetota bacterium]
MLRRWITLSLLAGGSILLTAGGSTLLTAGGSALLTAGCAAPPAPTLTVDALFADPPPASPLPSHVRWTPLSKLSYVQDGTLWTFDPETGARADVLDWTAVPEARDYAWSPDEHAILIEGKHLFVFKDGTGRPLTSGPRRVHDAKWSPDGAWISFIRDHDIWIVPSGGGEERRVTEGGSESLLNGELDWVYPEELGIDTGYWWSPDAKRIAFLQLDESGVTEFPLVDHRPFEGRAERMRYPKAGGANPKPRVGIRALEGGSEWAVLPVQAEYVGRVQWNGAKLAIQTLNRRQNQLLVSDEAGRILYTEEGPEWVDLWEDLCFFDGRWAYSSDRSGFAQVYVDGQAATSGEWSAMRIVGGGAPLYFLGCEGDSLERHLYRWSGGRVERLTQESGWHDASVSPDGKWILDTWSRATRPPRMAVMRPDGTGRRLFAESVLSMTPVAPELIRVPAADGTRLKAWLYRPAASGRRPLIVHTYGGPGSRVVADRWHARSFLWHQLLVERGFVVALVDNRGSRGGGAMRAIHRRLGALEVMDLESAARHLKTLPGVDPDRVGLWGWSYGGYMTCLAMTKTKEFRAGIAVAPVTHWGFYDTIYTERYMERPQDNPEGYRESAPLEHAANLHGRLLLVHGLADDNVHWQNTERFVDELIKAGKAYELLVYPGQSHGIGARSSKLHLFHRMTEFFERNLAR